MKSGWVYGVGVKGSGKIQVTVANPVPYAGIVFRANSKQFGRVPRNIQHFIHQLASRVS